jgi:acetyl-CoA synthetase
MTGLSVKDELEGYLQRYGSTPVALADLLCDSHPRARVALVCDGETETRMSFGDLADRSARLAGSLVELGVRVGDRVAVLMPKSPELLITVLAIWRSGAVHVPLFTAFGPDAVDYRIAHSDAVLVVTDAGNRAKITSGVTDRRVPVVVAGTPRQAGDVDFSQLVDHGAPLNVQRRDPGDPFILIYTSGTTGQPKGVAVPVRALTSFHSYVRHGLDVRPEDVAWNFADPGWAYGLYYGIVGTLLLGQTILWRTMQFDAADFFATLLRHGVTNIVGAPTVYRSLRSAGLPGGFKESHKLRAMSSGGEPLNAELLDWSRDDLGVPIRDHYGQSEVGMVAFGSQHPELSIEPVPGSMGIPARIALREVPCPPSSVHAVA